MTGVTKEISEIYFGRYSYYINVEIFEFLSKIGSC